MAFLAKNVNASKIQFSAPKTLSNQSRTVYANYEGDKLRIQTPLMHLPYGVGDNEKINASKSAGGRAGGGGSGFGGGGGGDGENQAKRYDLNVSFRGMDNDPKLKALHDKMQDIEKRIIDEAFENRQSWLRDDYDGVKTFVAKLFTPIVKYDKNKDTGKIEGKYPPTMKLKLPYDDKTDSFNFECSDMEDKELDFKGVMTKLKGGKARLIIQLGGIWFAGGRYGCTWRVVRAKFEVTSKCNVDFVEDSDDDTPGAAKKKPAFEEDDDLDEDAIANGGPASDSPINVKPPITKASPPAAAPVAPTTTVAESEDDDEEEEEEEDDDESEDDDPVPPPPPPPPPVKGKGKKAVAAK